VADDHADARWAVVANVVGDRLHGVEGEVRRGTKHFSPGTKVYLVSAYWGMGAERVTVLGLARRPKRWITVDVEVRVLEHWRAKVIYEPAVLRRLSDAERFDQERAEHVASGLDFVSSERRVRLVERSTDDAVATALEVERSGTTVVRASMPGAAFGTGTSPAYVLYDGAAPVGGATVSRGEHGYRTWVSVWVVRDRPETLADLIAAVQNREPDLALWLLPTLIHDIRRARGTDG
jgi:hypothetical protein